MEFLVIIVLGFLFLVSMVSAAEVNPGSGQAIGEQIRDMIFAVDSPLIASEADNLDVITTEIITADITTDNTSLDYTDSEVFEEEQEEQIVTPTSSYQTYPEIQPIETTPIRTTIVRTRATMTQFQAVNVEPTKVTSAHVTATSAEPIMVRRVTLEDIEPVYPVQIRELIREEPARFEEVDIAPPKRSEFIEGIINFIRQITGQEPNPEVSVSQTILEVIPLANFRNPNEIYADKIISSEQIKVQAQQNIIDFETKNSKDYKYFKRWADANKEEYPVGDIEKMKEIMAQYIYVRNEIEYKLGDTTSLERTQDALTTFNLMKGDCDEQGILLVSLLRSTGYDAKLVIVNQWKHAITGVEIPIEVDGYYSEGMYLMDTTCTNCAFGQLPEDDILDEVFVIGA